MTWDADKQLVRGNVRGHFNLAIGDPIFLRQIMAPYYPRHYPNDLPYPDLQPTEELMHELRKLHPVGEIVVTNGAKQGLLAAVTAYKQEYGFDTMYHKAPFWPSYPTIAELTGLAFNKMSLTGSIECVTSPNNPDGSLVRGDALPHIWDAAYFTSAYGMRHCSGPRHEVSVWSGGKFFGAPGVRVGWNVVKNSKLAEHMRRYIEQTGSGVSLSSQHHLAVTLRRTETLREELFERAFTRLVQNRTELREMLWEHVEYPAQYNTHGMFAWIQAKNPERFADALRDAKVMVVTGAACGDPTPGRYRISLGNTPDVHQEALTALRKELEK